MPSAKHFPASSVTRVSKSQLTGDGERCWNPSRTITSIHAENFEMESSLFRSPGLLAANTCPSVPRPRPPPLPPLPRAPCAPSGWGHFPFQQFTEEMRLFQKGGGQKIKLSLSAGGLGADFPFFWKKINWGLGWLTSYQYSKLIWNKRNLEFLFRMFWKVIGKKLGLALFQRRNTLKF